jgi:allantoinase
MIARQPDDPAVRKRAIRSQRVITTDGERAAAVMIDGEKITAIVAPEQVPIEYPVEDRGKLVVMPGIVDTHVHINEPGRTEWEGFETATRAAAAGGVTTLVDMPLNCSPVTTTPQALEQKLTAAVGKLWVDCGFYGGVVPGNTEQVEPLAKAGVLGFKAFLCPSGIDEFPPVTEEDLHAAMLRIAPTGLALLAHAEVVGKLAKTVETRLASRPRSYAAYLATRPAKWEQQAIQLLDGLCRSSGCRVHVVHVSSADGLNTIAVAKAGGLPVTAETCPHYLFLAAGEIPDGDTRCKCAPPIRSGEERRFLWEGLTRGTIDTIGSDHSPAPPQLKQLDTGDLKQAWGGIASLQLALSVVWTGACERGFSLTKMVERMCTAPARLVGLEGRKGALAAGHDADLVVFDPQALFKVEPTMLYHRHQVTPYEGYELQGRIIATFLRGRKVYEENRFCRSPTGQVLLAHANTLDKVC